MKSNFTIESVLSAKCGHLNTGLSKLPPKKRKAVKGRNDCKEVQWIHWQLKYWCIEKEVILEKEYRFHVKRKFRFDFFIPKLNCAIEYEGIFADNSRHTNKMGYSKDTEKYSLAATMGILVLRYTAINYKNIIQDIEKINKKYLSL